MSALNWAALITSLVTIVTAFVGSVRWLVKHYLNELKPNSGSSMRDEINELRARVETIISILQR